MRGARRERAAPKRVTVAAWALVATIFASGKLVQQAVLPAADLVLPPVVVLGELEHAPVRVVAAPPAPVTPQKRVLPRPFAELRTFASPLIMPRLRLPRALEPRFRGVSRLLARARPGEPLDVTLTAYCLQGSTRRGRPVRPGIIAADPHIFPFARYVELFAAGRFLGRFLVDDTGANVRGPRIDIWTPDCEDARRFGTRRGVATLVAAGGR